MLIINDYNEIRQEIIAKLEAISEILEDHNDEIGDDDDDLYINMGHFGYWFYKYDIENSQVEFVTIGDYLKVKFYQTVYYDDFEDVVIETDVPIHWFSDNELNRDDVVDYFLKMQKQDYLSVLCKDFHALYYNKMLNVALEKANIDSEWLFNTIREAYPELGDYLK